MIDHAGTVSCNKGSHGGFIAKQVTYDMKQHHNPQPSDSMAVRRLTPNECYRLQGFPDNWGRIPWKGKPAEECPDGPQYKAAGNSMAVPCMFWIGNRIAEYEDKA